MGVRLNVAADGRNLTIINEHGQRDPGYAAAHHEVVIPSLGIRGHVSQGPTHLLVLMAPSGRANRLVATKQRVIAAAVSAIRSKAVIHRQD